MATLIGTNGADLISGGSEGDWISGGSGDDMLYGNAGNDSLYAGKGTDTLVGGAGNDFMVCDGDDTVQFSGNFSDYSIVFSYADYGLKITDSVSGRDGTDTTYYPGHLQFADRTVSPMDLDYWPIAMNGTEGNDVLVGTHLSNEIFGYEGDDSIVGGAGGDSLDGGVGNDTIYGGDGDDLILVSPTWASADFDGNNVVYAGAGNDIIWGSTGNDLISGGDGIDTLHADSFSYGLISEEGVHVDLRITKAQDTGSCGIDKITGIENVVGAGFDDVLIGNSGTNILRGEDGNDTLDGGAGADVLYGGKGSDVFYVDNVLDQAIEESTVGVNVEDLVISSVSWTLGKDLEDLNLTGNAAINGIGNELNNIVNGNRAANFLSGNAGDDTLSGGAGADTLTGGNGADTFVFDAALTRKVFDTVTDFSVADDSIQLSHAVFSAIPVGELTDAAFQSANVSTALSAGVRIIFNSGTGALLYDADGTGHAAAVQFATLAVTGLSGTLTVADFIVA